MSFESMSVLSILLETLIIFLSVLKNTKAHWNIFPENGNQWDLDVDILIFEFSRVLIRQLDGPDNLIFKNGIFGIKVIDMVSLELVFEFVVAE